MFHTRLHITRCTSHQEHRIRAGASDNTASNVLALNHNDGIITDMHYIAKLEGQYLYHCYSSHCIKGVGCCSAKCCQQRLQARIELLKARLTEKRAAWAQLCEEIDTALICGYGLVWEEHAL